MADRDSATGPRGFVHRIWADRLGLRLFDPHWYRDASGRSGRRATLYRHFLTDGWRDGLDPKGWFSCAGYLRANPDVAESDVNPQVHFIRTGRQEQRALTPEAPISSQAPCLVGPLTLEDTLLASTHGLVDEQFYLAEHEDVAASGLTAAEHVTAYCWKKGRPPAPWFNTTCMRTHAPSFRLGTGRSLADLLRITTGAPPPGAAPTSWWVDPDAALPVLRGMRKTADVLVVIQAYYPEDLDVFTKYIKRLGASMQLVMTCPANTVAVCERWADRNGLQAVSVETVNRGRDWGPFLVLASESSHAGWGAVLKLHTKRSPHRDYGAAWLAHVLDGLIADEEATRRVHALFADQGHDILAAPGTLSWALGRKPDGRIAREVHSRFVNEPQEVRFPAGSMFWMSGRLLSRIAGLPITLPDFEPELGQLDCTLAHAIERLVVKLSPTKLALVPRWSLGPSDRLRLRNMRSTERGVCMRSDEVQALGNATAAGVCEAVSNLRGTEDGFGRPRRLIHQTHTSGWQKVRTPGFRLVSCPHARNSSWTVQLHSAKGRLRLRARPARALTRNI